jgi:hypothetical protein
MVIIITHITSRLVYWEPEKRCDIVISCLAGFHVSPIWGYKSHLHPRRLWYGSQTGSSHNLVWRLFTFWCCPLLLSPSSQHIIRWWTHFTLQCETMIVVCVQSFSSSGHTYRSHGFTRLASLITPAGKTPFPFSLYNWILRFGETDQSLITPLCNFIGRRGSRFLNCTSPGSHFGSIPYPIFLDAAMCLVCTLECSWDDI